ncbi:MAG: fumarylpyruvate hydrolase [Pseudohongiellaceae bacterium]
MEFIISPSAQASVPVTNSHCNFPVRRIYCVGQNYAEHVREMGGDPANTRPVFFSKPADAVVINNESIAYPWATENLHYEAELVVALKSGGRGLSPQDAGKTVFGYGVGIDFTRRDLQAKCKSLGQPWDVAKGFDQSAPISAIKPAELCPDVENSRIWLSVNGDIKQDGNTNDMIWNVAGIIAELSTFFELKAGDLVFTGTPSGVGAVSIGDKVIAGIEGVGELSLTLLQSEVA